MRITHSIGNNWYRFQFSRSIFTISFASFPYVFSLLLFSFCKFPGNLIMNIYAFVFHTKNVARGEKDYLDIWRKILGEREESVYSNNLWRDYHYATYAHACICLKEITSVYSTFFSKNFWFPYYFFFFFLTKYSATTKIEIEIYDEFSFHLHESKLAWNRI